MAARGGGRAPRSGWEGPFNLFSSVTATATATSHTSPDQVLCRGAKAVYIVVYDSTKANAATINTGSYVAGYLNPGATVINAGAAGNGCSVAAPATGTNSLATGGVFAVGSSTTNGTRLSVHSLGVVIVTSAGVAPNTMVADAYVDWGD